MPFWIGCGRGKRSSCASTQSRFSSTQRSAGPSAAKRGRVSFTAPSRASTRRFIRRTPSRRMTDSGTARPAPAKIISVMAAQEMVFKVLDIIF